MVNAPRTPFRIRIASPADLRSITAIYNEAIRTTTGTFDTRPRSLADRRRWFRSHDPRHPILVAEAKRGVVGWASLTSWSERAAYDETGEVSVYVDASVRGQGIGRGLLHQLVARAQELGYHTLLARVADGNDASLRVHATAGFTSVGTMREVGVKFGRRIDVHLLQWMAPADPTHDGAGRA
ncbi:MAG: N-acetyltransferase family protein [Thermoplasmata archaeon]|nr:N-acetyltransferase family protein [Thermoplasmata archaeon]